MSTSPAQLPPSPEPVPFPPLRPSRTLPAGEGWTWIVQGWRLFARSPLMWILSLLIVIVAMIVIGLVPILGHIVVNVLQAVIAGGYAVACRSLEQGGDFELEQLFAGFRTRFTSLLIVGLVLLAGTIVILLVFAAFVGFSILPVLFSGDQVAISSAVMNSIMSILLGGLVAAALFVPLTAAYWFAPALVILSGMGPLEAMKESFIGCMRNFVPFLVYGIVMFVFAIVAAIPLGLGYLVFVPVAIASVYAGYRGIFTEGAAVPA